MLHSKNAGFYNPVLGEIWTNPGIGLFDPAVGLHI